MTAETFWAMVDLLGPDVVSFAILLTGGMLLAYIVTVVLPCLPARTRKPAADELPTTCEPVASTRRSPSQDPNPSRRHWLKISETVDAEISRTAAIGALQAAATRQIDAVEFALQQIFTDIGSVSSYARWRLDEVADRSFAGPMQTAA